MTLTKAQRGFRHTFFRGCMSEQKSLGEVFSEYLECPESSINVTDYSFSVQREKELESDKVLTSRWHNLRFHSKQQSFLNSSRRFIVVPSGRRSGKTEIAKRRLVRKAISNNKHDGARFIAAAPTHMQAKRIFWADLKHLVPKQLQTTRPSESTLTIFLVNGSEIQVVGMDEPARIEGSPITHIALDEYANMKPNVWSEHIRAGLSDHKGTADFIGVPEGRNHYHELYLYAQSNASEEWETWEWPSSDILDPEEIASAKSLLDPITYQQEFEAKFVSFQGAAYYQFSDEHALYSLQYQLHKPLIFCFDFNVSPGVAVVCQEFEGNYQYNGSAFSGDDFTAVIGEVYIPNNSTTPKVCNALVNKYGNHRERVFCYGDATGGARGTAKVSGSDWDLVEKVLMPVFGHNLRIDVPRGNPRERVRLNAVNSRLKTVDDSIRLRIDSKSAPNLVSDFEGVRLREDTGEIDKTDLKLTHLTDALGYYIFREFPTTERKTIIEQF